MFWLIVGYLFLFIFRPYEYWEFMGAFHVERIYMIFLLLSVALYDGKQYRSGATNKGLAAFFIVLLLSSIFALDRYQAFTQTYDYFKLLIFYVLIILTIRDEKELKRFVLAYIGIMLLYVGKSAWEFFIFGRIRYTMGTARMVGIDATYGSPNEFAASIVYSLPFTWALLKDRLQRRWVRITLIFYAIMAPVCVIFTGSRAGMISVLLWVVLMVMSMRRISRKTLLLITSCAALFFAWTVMPEMYQKRFLTVFVAGIDRAADASAQGRIYTFIMGMEMFAKFPLLGVGPGNFSRGLELLGDASGLSPHNLYGMILGETGLLGTVSFFALVTVIFFSHRRLVKTFDKAKTDRERGVYRALSVAAIHVLILLLVNGFVGGNLYRFNWLWCGAIGVLMTHHFLPQPGRRTNGRANEMAECQNQVKIDEAVLGVEK